MMNEKEFAKNYRIGKMYATGLLVFLVLFGYITLF